MNVVGKVGSLISQGVYSVATPFHPFGGAVDIIVVEQEDGTYRSTPWYVRFGKFQGVLKGAEKVVAIRVNGVEANFGMHLDNSGEAYFMREVVSGSNDVVSTNEITGEQKRLASSGSNGNYENNGDVQQDRHNDYSLKNDDSIENEELLRYQDEQSSLGSSVGSPSYGNYQYGSLDEVENMVSESGESKEEMVFICVDGHVLTAPILSNEENTDNIKLDTPQFHLGPGKGTSEDFSGSGDIWDPRLFGDVDVATSKNDETSEHKLESPKGCENDSTHVEESGNIIQVETDIKDSGAGLTEEMFRSCLDLTSNVQDVDASDALFSKEIILEIRRESDSITITSTEKHMSIGIQSMSDESHVISATTAEKLEHDGSGDTKCKDDDDGSPHFDRQVSDISCSASVRSETLEPVTCEEKAFGAENSVQEDSGASLLHAVDSAREPSVSSPMSSFTEECHQSESAISLKNMFGLGFEISLCGNLLRPGMGRNSAEEAFESQRISEEVFKASGASIIKNGNLIVRYENKYLKWDNAAHVIVGKAVFGSNFSVELSNSIVIEFEETTKYRDDASAISASSSRWRLWPIPFRRSMSLRQANSDASSEELFVDSESGFQTPDMEGSTIQSPRKQYVRTNIPTSEQVASLKLKEGQNMVTFSFSTRVLGKQQVDAHIYLWKWNARIVISDVDGTITKSDVLGQFMPLVGKDWTQSGVAGLFCAIKENGYQLLFLSARAIVQAYITRNFLFNLKQDGKALPSGPVVISPDGLFPSLYREVIRRAPHEFKIACLEDIKALFPSDYNPFYAGFGNRDTDELSYRKIGIPKGKIFIINPKGEVAVNHCVDVKSYTSLHTLVNDIFPPTSLVEQEDFNSWNYWKMPCPEIDS